MFLEQLEEIADSFEGVDKSFAIQAGREIRIIVKPEKITGASNMPAPDPIQANTGLAFLSFFPYASFLILFHTLRLKHAQHSIYENIQSQNPYAYF